MNKKLGKLSNVQFGLGLSVTIKCDGCGVNDNKSTWDVNQIEWSERCKWTEEDRSKGYDEIMRYVSDLLSDAKITSIDQLNGKPVEVTFDGNMLKSWRILTEVI